MWGVDVAYIPGISRRRHGHPREDVGKDVGVVSASWNAVWTLHIRQTSPFAAAKGGDATCSQITLGSGACLCVDRERGEVLAPRERDDEAETQRQTTVARRRPH